MQHYDGPAFYRKKNKRENEKKYKMTSKSQSEEKKEFKSDVNGDKKQIFRPSFVPPSFIGKSQKLRKSQIKYQQLFNNFKKNAEDYLLFDEALDSDVTDIVDDNSIQENIIVHTLLNNESSSPVDSDTHSEKSENELDYKQETDEVDEDTNGSGIILAQPTEVNTAIFREPLITDKNIFEKPDVDKVPQTTDSTVKQETYTADLTKPKSALRQIQHQRQLPGINEEKQYKFPSMDFLPPIVKVNDDTQDEWVLAQIETLNETLEAFHVDATVKDWTIGPAVTQFELTLEKGVKVNKITNLIDDLKLALAAKDIRIEAPIPGQSSVGVEIPNLKARPVMLSEVLDSTKFKEQTSPLTVALGVNLSGESIITDLRKMPHGLIAGATGSGKSVFINSVLVSLLYKATPQEVKLLLIDPKAVEMAPYHDIPHLLAPVISDPVAASAALKWVVEEMEERYQKLAAAGVRNIEGFNEKVVENRDFGLCMSYIVIVIDELADLMMVASSEVQDYIARITQKARAAGIHLLIATQRPSVDVITGTIKNNIPTRVAFMVSSQVDSRTIIDVGGAERLLGRGDMLYLGNGASQPIRLQGTFVQNEVDKITDFVRSQGKPNYSFDPDGLKKQALQNEQEDELLPEILDYLVNEENTSTSKLQRTFAIGYNRAANIIDVLEARRYISPARGSKPREVYLTKEGLDKIRNQVDY